MGRGTDRRARDPGRLRLVLWNVRSLRDDREAVAEVVVGLAPDLVLLTEAPRFALRWRRPVHRLARDAGMVQVPAGRPDCGLLALVRPGTPVDQVVRRRLTAVRGLHRRALLGLTVLVDGEPLRVVSTHLDVAADARLAHAEELLRLEPTADVIAGDLNESPSGAAWRLLAAQREAVETGPTFPARAPRRRIDAVLVGKGWTATGVDPRSAVGAGAEAVRQRLAAASDHLPVVAEIRRDGPQWLSTCSTE